MKAPLTIVIVVPLLFLACLLVAENERYVRLQGQMQELYEADVKLVVADAKLKETNAKLAQADAELKKSSDELMANSLKLIDEGMRLRAACKGVRE